VYDHLINTRIGTLQRIQALEIVRQMAMGIEQWGKLWICYLPHINGMVHILQELVHREKYPNNAHVP
jgi:hypothetical protein